jgi:hypothetical protein
MREGVRQVWRHAGSWVLLLALPVLPALAASQDPWRLLAGALLGPFAWQLGLEIAAATAGRGEHVGAGSVLRGAAMMQLLRRAVHGTWLTLRLQARTLLLVLGLGALALALAHGIAVGLQSPMTASPPGDGVERTTALFLPVAMQLFVGLVLLHGLAPAVGSMRPLLQALHGLDPVTATRMLRRAAARHRVVFGVLDLLLLGSCFVVLLVAPPLAPLALAWLPAVLLAAVRELFGPRERAPAHEAAREATAPAWGRTQAVERRTSIGAMRIARRSGDGSSRCSTPSTRRSRLWSKLLSS